MHYEDQQHELDTYAAESWAWPSTKIALLGDFPPALSSFPVIGHRALRSSEAATLVSHVTIGAGCRRVVMHPIPFIGASKIRKCNVVKGVVARIG